MYSAPAHCGADNLHVLCLWMSPLGREAWLRRKATALLRYGVSHLRILWNKEIIIVMVRSRECSKEMSINVFEMTIINIIKLQTYSLSHKDDLCTISYEANIKKLNDGSISRYRISCNFRVGLIFANFMTSLKSLNIYSAKIEAMVSPHLHVVHNK